MAKADSSEVERRVAEITELLINRIGSAAIIGYTQRKWGLGPRQAAEYLARARARIARSAEETREQQFSRALASYEAIAAKQLAVGQYAAARRTLDSEMRLLGLLSPEQPGSEAVVNIIQVPPDARLP